VDDAIVISPRHLEVQRHISAMHDMHVIGLGCLSLTSL
jgi:hypothetical protein